ncbi:MAG: hypothetical protein LBN43_07095 [Oscillospiraceae bacterium]|jgi:hypothetical protein|nr:hypothetical protein [Oscillospiraceae bacterium]
MALNIGKLSGYGTTGYDALGSIASAYKQVSSALPKTGDKKISSISDFIAGFRSNKNTNAGIEFVGKLKTGSAELSGALNSFKAGDSKENAIKKTERFVDSYNKLYAVSAEGGEKAEKLASLMVKNSKMSASELASIGIGFDEDGKMTINKETLDKAAEDNKVQSFFTENQGKNYGFTNRLDRVAIGAQRNTSQYVDPKLFTDDSDNTAMTYTNTLFSALSGLARNKNFGAGMLMDFFV